MSLGWGAIYNRRFIEGGPLHAASAAIRSAGSDAGERASGTNRSYARSIEIV